MQTVLITGASSGFGAATARLLAAQKDKYRLILVARREDRLQELAKELKSPTFVKALDITNKKAVAEFHANLPAEFKNIDVLVNNAGLALGLDPAYDADLGDWEKMVATNINGLLYFTHAALKIMKANNRGLIINIGSCSAEGPYRGGNVYGASKAFVKQFSRNLRTDLLGTDIRVSNIEPGMAETEFSKVRFKGDDDKAGSVYANTRHLTANDIAETILWIIERPAHVNIDNVEIMPIDQTWGGFVVNRT